MTTVSKDSIKGIEVIVLEKEEFCW